MCSLISRFSVHVVPPAQNMCHLANYDSSFTFHTKCHLLKKALPIDSPGILWFQCPIGLLEFQAPIAPWWFQVPLTRGHSRKMAALSCNDNTHIFQGQILFDLDNNPTN